MKLYLLCDIHWESRVDKALHEMPKDEISRYFEEQNYGLGLASITIIFMCRDPSLHFKRRIRLSKGEKTLYMDIMLDFNIMKAATPEERKREVAQRLYDEVPQVLSKYKIPDFDKDRFIADFQAWIDGLGWR